MGHVAGGQPRADGRAGRFHLYAPEPVPYAVARYTDEVDRLYGVLDRRLAGREFICGDYSIADMACWPWIMPHAKHGQDITAFPDLQRWYEQLKTRPAPLRRGFDVGEEIRQLAAADPGRGSAPRPLRPAG